MSYSNKESVEAVRGTDQDFEFYPTTDEIIQVIKTDIHKNGRYLSGKRILDCGAGDGRVLKAIVDANGEFNQDRHSLKSEYRSHLFAIEKSETLIKRLPEYVFPIGVDFHDQNLMTMNMDIIYCNPPYSEFLLWLSKIVSEVRSGVAYMTIPDRWRDNYEIQRVILDRNITVDSLGFFDFEKADRGARCHVEVIKLSFKEAESPLKDWIKENFKIEEKADRVKESLKDRVEKQRQSVSNGHSLVAGNDYVDTLVQLYQQDLDNLFNSFQKICSIDSENLEFFDLNINKLSVMVQEKAANIRARFWSELINNIDVIKQRFSSSVRYAFTQEMNSHKSAEFTHANIRAFLLWVLKNAKHYDEVMFEETIKKFISFCNIESYKSNRSRFVDGDWTYSNFEDITEENKFKFNTTKRMILESFFWKNELIKHGSFSDGCTKIIDDLLILAESRGYKTMEYPMASELRDVEYSKVYDFKCKVDGKEKTLFTMKAFKKGTIHLNFDYDFITLINIELGKRKGWVTTPEQAAEELEIPIESAMKMLSNVDSRSIILDENVLMLTNK